MGLRFRKSISIMPGVKLNFGTKGMSVSAGVPGFRKTFHTSGRVTTSVGIPGTGLYYVDTKNPNKQSNRRNTQSQIREQSGFETAHSVPEPLETPALDQPARYEETVDIPLAAAQLDTASLKSIHKTSDDSIDWTEVLVSPTPPDDTYNEQMWRYYHSMAPKILSGDVDTYLQLIYEVNPLDDLLSYGGNYEFGTDDPKKIEVEFSVNELALSTAKQQMSTSEYNTLLQDFVCSVCIRIARDMFALLPVMRTVVHAVLNGDTIVSVDFDRTALSKVKFGYVDPSDTISKFRHNMQFSTRNGFDSVGNMV